MAAIILVIIAVYVGLGLVSGLAIMLRGLGAIDASARSAPWTFKLLIFPGVVAMWPLLVVRWARAGRTSGEVHR